MKDRIKYCLNNENGNPNLQNLIGLAFAMTILCGMYPLGRSVYRYICSIPASKAGLSKSVVVGYNIS